MTQYGITMVTFSQAIPSGSSGTDARRAFFGQTNINFSSARIDQIAIEDDDTGFNSIRIGDPSYPRENQQTLVSPTFIGNNPTPFPAGTQLSGYSASIIQDSQGQRFYAIFTTSPDPAGGVPIEIGARHSALILPIPSLGTGGVSIWPSFNPALSFRYVSSFNFSATQHSVLYDPNAVVPPTDPACFTPGTIIQTRSGPREVQDLRIGDLIITRDNGPQPLRWIGGCDLDARRLDLAPNLRPIRIAQNALGQNLPLRDLVLSPQHRVLLRSPIVARMFDCPEVLVAAKHLVGMPGISVCRDITQVSYLHLLFDDHQIVLSNGSWSESLFIGPQAMKSLYDAQRREILALFPELAFTAPAPARPMPNGRQSRQLLQRHVKNGRNLVSAV